jgi:glycosyltransferase involved in cell wall biosynthesis
VSASKTLSETATRTNEPIGLVHDYLLVMRGAERVFGAIADCWPTAPIYTSLYSPTGTEGRFSARTVRTSWLQRLPVDRLGFRALMPLYPRAIERLEVGEHDLVISSTSAFAHGVRPRPDAVHVSACHTPFRYVWHEREIALAAAPRPLRPLVARRLAWHRRWDLEAAKRVTHFITFSELGRRRIESTYGREASVVHPGIELERFAPGTPEDFFLFVGQLVPHKRVERALDAAERARVPIEVVGDGPELKRLRARYGAAATFHGRLDDKRLAALYARARALVIPGIEEFGLTALEAQAAGRPVLAVDAGGACETIVDGETGVLVADDDPDALAEAMRQVDFERFDPARLRRHAEGFSVARFKQRFAAEVRRLAGG